MDHDTPSPPTDVASVDEEILSELFELLDDGRSDGLVRACDLFLVGVPNHLAQAEGALADGRLADAARVAHSLRGTSGAFGARRLSHLADHLEQACNRAQPSAARALVDAMQAELAAFRPVLTARLASVAGR